jgi:ElaB/YqjD/DUF883 family membrane-anchored ribosome-binding protein
VPADRWESEDERSGRRNCRGYGEAIQRQINQADEASDQLTKFIREYPISAILIAAGVGYIFGKII